MVNNMAYYSNATVTTVERGGNSLGKHRVGILREYLEYCGNTNMEILYERRWMALGTSSQVWEQHENIKGTA